MQRDHLDILLDISTGIRHG